ncbi:hypothetical protein Tco_0847380 [Tanacetum coccineum]
MPPTMMTRSACQLAAASQGGGKGIRAGGQGSEVNGGVNGVPDFSTIIVQQLLNLLTIIVAQVGDQGRGQGDGRNQNGDAVNDNIQGDVSRGCTYKEFLVCNPKKYDGKGGAIVYTRWIEKMESIHDMNSHTGQEAAVGMSWEDFKNLTREEFCPSNEIQKSATEFWNHAMVGALSILRILIGFISWLATEPKTIQKAVQLAGTLIDEALRNGSIKKNPEKWEVIKNGNKVLRRTVGTVEQEYEPTTAKEK